jgi:hypothetical protein
VVTLHELKIQFGKSYLDFKVDQIQFSAIIFKTYVTSPRDRQKNFGSFELLTSKNRSVEYMQGLPEEIGPV